MADFVIGVGWEMFNVQFAVVDVAEMVRRF